MNKKFNLFAKIYETELLYEMILAESNRPILFICKDENSKRYICSCHCANRERSEWIVVPIDRMTIIKLLTNQLTIREAFTQNNSQVTIITRYPGDTSTHYCKLPIDQAANILPTAGYFMEAEPDEFAEELSRLEEEQQLADEYIQVSHTNTYIMRRSKQQITFVIPFITDNNANFIRKATHLRVAY